MKRVLLAGALVAPPMLFVAAQGAPPKVVIPKAALPTATASAIRKQPVLVGTDPDGAAFLTWAPDGQSVQLAPTDRRQNLHWGDCSLPASKGSSVPELTPSKVPLWEIRQGEAGFGSTPQTPSLVISSPDGKPSVPLQNSPWDLFGSEFVDSLILSWRFQGSTFSPDYSRVFIASLGSIYSWSTRTGKRLGCVAYHPSPRDMQFSVAFSSDSRWLLAPSVGGVFDTRTGRKRFGIPISHSLYPPRWNPDGRVFCVEYDHSACFFDALTGHPLWRAATGERPLVRFVPELHAVVLLAAKGLELRDARTGKAQRFLPDPNENATDADDFAASPDGSQLWASYANGQIWSWRIR